MNINSFNEEVKKLGITLTKEQMDTLEKLYELLINYNENVNLTRIVEHDEVYLKHFYDSLTLNKVVDLKKIKTLCDVGTGAGFPGIVLKIIFPDIKITLIDSLQKRVNYLNTIIKELELNNIEAIHTRGEDFKGKYDVVTSRAVANVEKLMDYTMHKKKKKGIFVAMKAKIENELTEKVRNNIENKYIIIKEEKFYLPIEESERTLLVIKNK